jgi:uncharacterized protein (TIGR03435 family)
MMMIDDMEFVREYARRQSELAFETIVSRYVNLVYSAAVRQVHDPHLAEEITQVTFIILARKAHTLGRRTILASWLHRTAVFVAADALKNQRRRVQREQEAHMQSEIQHAEPGPVWELIAPLLDNALVRLGEKDRQAILLHYFQRKTFAEVGGALGMSEDAARRRTNRALEKLRKLFTQHGVNSTSTALAGAISAGSLQLAPFFLTKSVTAAALSKGATASASTLTLTKGALKLMTWTKTKTAIVAGAVLLLAVGTTAVSVQKVRDDRLEKIWRINKEVPATVLDTLPPLFKVVPTKFGPPWTDYNAGSHGDKFAGARAPVDIMALYAYGYPAMRIRFADPEPTNLFDFVATLPHGNEAALRRFIKDKFGLVGRPTMENMDVFLLRVSRPNAQSLKPAITGKHDSYWKAGVYHASNATIDNGAPRFEGVAHFLEHYFSKPVIDQTGLTQYYNMELRWKETKYGDNPDALKQALLDQFGLELLPTNMPVEMLVMEKEH